jgi:hypothetical protein
MDLRTIEERLDQGRSFNVTYEYPSTVRDNATGSIYRRRTDRLLDVSSERRRLFVAYGGHTPIWIEAYEVIRIDERRRKRSLC